MRGRALPSLVGACGVPRGERRRRLPPPRAHPGGRFPVGAVPPDGRGGPRGARGGDGRGRRPLDPALRALDDRTASPAGRTEPAARTERTGAEASPEGTEPRRPRSPRPPRLVARPLRPALRRPLLPRRPPRRGRQRRAGRRSALLLALFTGVRGRVVLGTSPGVRGARRTLSPRVPSRPVPGALPRSPARWGRS
jgi:hypothetical protein